MIHISKRWFGYWMKAKGVLFYFILILSTDDGSRHTLSKVICFIWSQNLHRLANSFEFNTFMFVPLGHFL